MSQFWKEYLIEGWIMVSYLVAGSLISEPHFWHRGIVVVAWFLCLLSGRFGHDAYKKVVKEGKK